ncbi:Cobalt-zinc-cadmium resistance protein CzcD [Pseudomonas synxantha]|uniref:Cobalt-zinc-cadmium resistance protein CzcD n=1 Tax=Pseudomonas synxantha TaxID=47883 RepID=A0A3G7U2G1_9PSED|nr:hypothetical protein [Pseudomonas synxantha]AZE52868.1 Cobalt-zinc-cadmium resistance protein CzcD [Pseudomonas synxantha]
MTILQTMPADLQLLHEQFNIAHATIQVEGEGFQHDDHDEVHA